MAVDFRGHPMFAPGFNSPTRFEADVYDCEVWGQIPSDIDGTVDAQRMEEGAVAVVKLPFRLRGGTHVNWFSSEELAAQEAESA